jgi:hypothetical protein
MTQVLDSPRIDHAAVAAAVEGVRERGATCQALFRADGTDVCVNAVCAGRKRWSGYSKAASKRAAAGGPRMLPVLDSGEVDGRLWIAYDLGSARSLADHRGRRVVPTTTALRVLSDVAKALDEARAEGLFACELPPASVFVTGKGARLGDLGTAREGLAGAKFELEGDPAYVPPEVLRSRHAGERSGVYLYGALLHYLLTGAAPPRGPAAPLASGHLGLPASIEAIVATAMADDPNSRPDSVSEVHEMARRAVRGEPPSRSRRPRPTEPGAAGVVPKTDAARPPARRRVAARLPTGRLALAVGGALLVGAAAGLLLGSSPDPAPARAQTVTAGGLSVTLPSGRHRIDPGGTGLSVQAPGSRLHARILDRPLPPRPVARPVQLGALQAWRHAAGGVVRYSIPTTGGTLAVTCRSTASGSSRPLRLCERTASTLRVGDARALPLATAAEDSRRLRTAIAALKIERDAGRARLAGAYTPEAQRLAAQDLADSHARAATAFRELAGAQAIEAAARGAADAYSLLAASAEDGPAGRWNEASERVRRSDAVLIEAVAVAR